MAKKIYKTTIYNVIEDWVDDFENGICVKSFSTLKNAWDYFNKRALEVEKDTAYNTYNRDDTTFEAFDLGFYTHGHVAIRISETILDNLKGDEK